MPSEKGITLRMQGQPVQMKVGMTFQCLPPDYEAYTSGLLKDKDRYNICHSFGTKTCRLESLPVQHEESDEDVLLTVVFQGEDEAVQLKVGDLSLLPLWLEA